MSTDSLAGKKAAAAHRLDNIKKLAETKKISRKRAAKLVDAERAELLSCGMARVREDGQIIVYADYSVDVPIKARHINGAIQSDAAECPLARAMRELFISRSYGEFVVGNATAKAAGKLNPNINVKFSLSPETRKAVREYDDFGTWTLKTAWLVPYIASSRPGAKRNPNPIPRGPNLIRPTRRLRFKYGTVN